MAYAKEEYVLDSQEAWVGRAERDTWGYPGIP